MHFLWHQIAVVVCNPNFGYGETDVNRVYLKKQKIVFNISSLDYVM